MISSQTDKGRIPGNIYQIEQNTKLTIFLEGNNTLVQDGLNSNDFDARNECIELYNVCAVSVKS